MISYRSALLTTGNREHSGQSHPLCKWSSRGTESKITCKQWSITTHFDKMTVVLRWSDIVSIPAKPQAALSLQVCSTVYIGTITTVCPVQVSSNTVSVCE